MKIFPVLMKFTWNLKLICLGTCLTSVLKTRLVLFMKKQLILFSKNSSPSLKKTTTCTSFSTKRSKSLMTNSLLSLNNILTKKIYSKIKWNNLRTKEIALKAKLKNKSCQTCSTFQTPKSTINRRCSPEATAFASVKNKPTMQAASKRMCISFTKNERKITWRWSTATKEKFRDCDPFLIHDF